MELTNSLTAQQLFWGHNGFQYGFLSGEDSPYSSEVERLCTSVGTPDGVLPEPFLLSMPYEDKLFWALCCNGDPDKSNRSTLLFHILIVNRADVERLGINAFDVWESNGFSSFVDYASTVEIPVNSRYRPKSSDFDYRVIDNRVIISSRPEPDVVFQLVQSRINEIPWATYSFRFLSQMEVSALSDKAPEPDFTSPKSLDYDVNVQKNNTEPAPSANMKKLLIGSLILNVVLLLGYFVLPGVTVQSLRNKLPDDRRFTNEEWETAKKQTCLETVFTSAKEKDNAEKIEAYIEFVNNNIIKGNNHILQEGNE